MSASLMVPFELEYMKTLQWIGWNSAAVMTSVNSSMLTGLISTMSGVSSGRVMENRHTKALVTDVQVPQVDPQIVSGDVCLAVRVDGDRVDVVSMRVGVDLARDSRSDGIMRCHAGQSQRNLRLANGARRVAVRVVVFRNHLDLLVKHFPQLDCLVWV